MRRYLVSLVAILALVAIPAYAVNVTLAFTQAQVDIATWKYNQASAAQRAAFPTLQLWFANEVATMISQWAIDKQTAEARSVCAKFNAFSGANKTATCTAFSLTSGQTFATDPSGCVAVCP